MTINSQEFIGNFKYAFKSSSHTRIEYQNMKASLRCMNMYNSHDHNSLYVSTILFIILILNEDRINNDEHWLRAVIYSFWQYHVSFEMWWKIEFDIKTLPFYENLASALFDSR